MSKRHGAREQKKLAKKKSKRDLRRKQLARLTSDDPTIRFQSADRWPIVAALVPEDLWEAGIGNLVLARSMPDGQLAVGIFLVDAFCLGVKNALWKIIPPGAYHEMIEEMETHGRLKSVTPEYFSKLVHCAADYGQSLGFPPHRDFRHARLLLVDIDPSQCDAQFTFGKDGKPFYVRGPYEPVERAKAIAARVHELGGHYLIAGGEEEFSAEDTRFFQNSAYLEEVNVFEDDEEDDDEDILDE